MSIDEQKEAAAKKAMHFAADLLEQKKIKILESFDVLRFLGVAIEAASDEAELKKVEADFQGIFPKLPAFSTGV